MRAAPLAAGLALLAAGCFRPALRPERMDAEALRALVEANWAPVERIEVQWTALLEAPGVGVAPFRMDVDWSADGVRLELKTPFGGDLATLSCRPGESVGAQGGSKLKKNVERALGRVGDGRLRGLLEAGAEALFKGDDRPGFRLELKDPALAPLLAALEPQIPGGWLEKGRCDREALAPWLWGEWRPAAGAEWRPAGLDWALGDSVWTVDSRRGLPEAVRVDGLEIALADWTKQKKVWLPGRMEIVDRDARRRLVLERRGLRINRPKAEESE